jgi:hypothetical protein
MLRIDVAHMIIKDPGLRDNPPATEDDFILDLEFPRLGLIRIDSFDQVLVDVRQSMK